jgi:hypothetical protein
VHWGAAVNGRDGEAEWGQAALHAGWGARGGGVWRPGIGWVHARGDGHGGEAE